MIVKQPPIDLSLLVGDCVHSMRAALDHIAYQLATNYTKTLSDREAKSIEFPVISNPDDFSRMTRKGDPAPGSGLAKIRYIDPVAQALIETMQPYKGEDWELLALLHDLDRIDKHRELALSVAMSQSIEVDCGDNARLQLFSFEPPGRIKHKDVLCRFRCVHKRGRKGKVKPKADATFTVALKEGPEGWAIVEQLGAIDELIRDRVIPPLAPFLDAPS